MSSLDDAVAELVAWGQDRARWPSAAVGLINIVATGLADRGIAAARQAAANRTATGSPISTPQRTEPTRVDLLKERRHVARTACA